VWCDHQRPRAKKASKIVPDISFIVQTPVTGEQQVYLANTSNEAKFISLLISHLRTKGSILVEATADADADIVSTALNSARHYAYVTVAANDNDIPILLVHHLTVDMYDITAISQTRLKKSGEW